MYDQHPLSIEFQTKPISVSSELSEVGTDSEHGVYLGYVDCHDGSRQPVIEVRERHGEKNNTRRFAMSSVAHALLNLGPDEEFDLANRVESPAATAIPSPGHPDGA